MIFTRLMSSHIRALTTREAEEREPGNENMITVFLGSFLLGFSLNSVNFVA